MLFDRMVNREKFCFAWGEATQPGTAKLDSMLAPGESRRTTTLTDCYGRCSLPAPKETGFDFPPEHPFFNGCSRPAANQG